MMNPSRFLSIALVCAATAAAAADSGEQRLWPVPLGPAVSSNFCEYRDGRFHAGLDVRTGGREGVPCRAVANGWVSRVRAGSLGYGKALYVTLEDGDEVVYAHLAEFMPALEDSLEAAQRRAGRYNVDFYLSPRAFHVARGQVIAWAGATGTAGPHLHFETRSGDVAINPFLRGFAVKDRERPVFSKLALVPLAPDARVEGICQPMEIAPRRAGTGRYTIADTLRLSGRVGVAASVIDRLNSASGRLAPYEMQVWADDSLVSRIVLDQFAFGDAGEVDLLYHAGANRARGVTFFELYRREGETLGGREFARGGSLLPARAGGVVHSARVVALDVAGNAAEVLFHYVDSPAAPPAGRTPSNARAPVISPDLAGAYFADGFAVVATGGDGPPLGEHSAAAAPGTVTLRASDLAGRVRALAGAADGDTATVYASGLLRGAGGSLRVPALGVSVSVPPDGLFGDGVVFVTRAQTGRVTANNGLVMVSDPVRVGPVGWVTRRGFDVRLEAPGSTERDAVFRFDDRKRTWSFLAGERDAAGITARSTRPGVFAVLRDTTPPWLGSPQLTWPQSYATGKPYAEILVPVEDSGSGIDDTRITVTVGGVERYARWDFAKKKIVVALRDEPIIGPQPVHVVVFDKAGNQSVADATVVFETR
jgi:hypothetical protein